MMEEQEQADTSACVEMFCILVFQYGVKHVATG